MKKQFIVAGILLAMGVGAAQAAEPPTQKMIVSGKITTPACEVSVGNDGVYSYETIGSSLIHPSQTKTLRTISQPWLISCDADTYMTFQVEDEATDSAPTATHQFGLGFARAGKPLGYYLADMKNAKVDEVASHFIRFTKAGGNSTYGVSLPLDTNFQFGWGVPSSYALRSGKNFTMDLDVTATLYSATTMGGALTDDVDLQGAATLVFKYGI